MIIIILTEISKASTLQFKALNYAKITEHIIILSIIKIVKEISKAPTLQFKAVNQTNITEHKIIMYVEIETVT